MVNFTLDQIRNLMDKRNSIRNVSVIAHVDHGKSTLTDTLIAAAGIIAQQDIGKRVTDTDPEEQLKGITIKSTGISLHFETNNKEYVINLIDSPGHVDFSSEVTAALRLTDGALVLVDCVEGCCVQTETVLRQALTESIKPVLAVNKMDRAFFELHLDPESLYQSLCRTISDVNVIISTNMDEQMGDVTVYPEKGTVSFTAGKQGWGFTLKQFAQMYSKKLGVNEEKLVSRLWGDNYFDSETKKWYTTPISDNGKVIPRAFCKFVVEPIQQVLDACTNEDQKEKLEKLLKNLNIELTLEEKKLPGKELVKVVMQRWLPASQCLLDMISTHLPSPVTAQKYRVEKLYTGPMDDPIAASIRNCDPNGPLVLFISKMVPNKDKSRFLAFGRIFSGTVRQGQKVHVLGPNYTYGKKDDLYENATAQRVVIMMGRKIESFESVPCGNTVAIVGIDNYLSKSGTVVSDLASYPIVSMKFSVAPVVRVSVQPKQMSDLPKLVEGLKKLCRYDTLVQCVIEPTGEHVVCCASDFHLEICLKELRSYLGNTDLVVNDPVVSYMETVTTQSQVALSKSPNGHNRLYVQAENLDENLIAAIEKGLSRDEPKSRAKILVNDYGWNATDSRSIWAFGPTIDSSNVIVDSTKGVQYTNEIKDSMVAAFNWATKEGVLAEEPMRGVKFSLVDAMLHTDAIHRGGGQIIPAARRAFYASQLMAKPTLLEPIFLVEIQGPSQALSGIYSVLNARRGIINEAIQKSASLYSIKGYLPVMESFGFVEHLRAQTSGQAFPQCFFDHWEVISGDALDSSSKLNEIIQSIRKRKGLAVEIPPLTRFLDKL